jgi:hypothetical protein
MSRTLNRVPAVRIRQSPPYPTIVRTNGGGCFVNGWVLGSVVGPEWGSAQLVVTRQG